MRILAIDTAASLCAASIHDTAADTELGRSVLDLGKGHAEHVMAVIDAALGAAGCTYQALDAIAVCVGPGSFTGVRVGVAAARGLALALRIPAIGVSTLEALAAEARETFPERPVLVVLGQRREQLFAAGFGADGDVLLEPASLSADDLANWARRENPVLCGSAASLVAEAGAMDFTMGAMDATADIATYARLAAAKGAGAEKPKPLYLRAPDAAPQQNFALPRKGA
ncbi:tRNA (adenosine(37)-N6)-threonylcarbamoyltransferase complex dimerization subunit type 1 TsaB [Nitratireductor soli]|uniref:tRNA (adenosine(37)-N6)-threonylcarbamoyltransferase complex dimerization subunit type 1 TsaB n=1 Tax=Nitratireductor soli TaxID=1670619 RepID=UPI00065DDCA4|nr:tRNA (adenosine(37)-N6)-threonylcarbamoyltransferase complex dimerization subunit type 1 TsaB [Nitratireductor soli]